MTKTIQLSAIIAAAAIGIGFAVTGSTPARADGTLLDKCHGSSRAVVENCCSAWVTSNGKTNWMIETGANCSNAASCSYKRETRVNYCYLQNNLPGKSSPSIQLKRG